MSFSARVLLFLSGCLCFCTGWCSLRTNQKFHILLISHKYFPQKMNDWAFLSISKRQKFFHTYRVLKALRITTLLDKTAELSSVSVQGWSSFLPRGITCRRGEEHLRNLKGHGNETDFLGFLQKSLPHESLALPFEPFRFWLRIRGDIRIQKMTPRYHRYGESPTPRISDTGSRLLNFFKETLCIDDTESRRLPAPVILWLWVAQSAYHRYGEPTTPHIVESGSRRLRGSVIQGVAIQRKN